MTWKHKILNKDGWYGVYEVYEDGTHTVNPIDISGESPEELIILVGQILQDIMEDIQIVGKEEDL